MTPTVRVVVPCYGYAEELPGCVATILAQRGVDVRVLIVDDGSPDPTPAVAARLMEADDRVEYRRHLKNSGLIATANDGMIWAMEADYWSLISADDLLVPGALARATSVMEQHPSVGMTYGHAPYFETGKPLPKLGRRWWGTKVWPGPQWIEKRCRSGHNCISSPEVVVRTSTQQKVGPYDPHCHHASDLNMWLRIAAISDIAYIQGKAQALYRVHPDSMLRSATSGGQGRITDLTERRQAFTRFFAATNGSVPDLLANERHLRRALAKQALWQASRAIDRNDPSVPTGPLVAFAKETSPEAQSLPEYRGFTLRRRMHGHSAYFPPFLLAGALHRLSNQTDLARRRCLGI
jgi:Glycosyl transferase family 2